MNDARCPIALPELAALMRAILERPLRFLTLLSHVLKIHCVMSSDNFTVLAIKVEKIKEPVSEYITFIIDTRHIADRDINLTIHVKLGSCITQDLGMITLEPHSLFRLPIMLTTHP